MEKLKINRIKYIFDPLYREAINLIKQKQAVSSIVHLVGSDGKNIETVTLSIHSTEEQRLKFHNIVHNAIPNTSVKLTLLNVKGEVIYDIDAKKK